MNKAFSTIILAVGVLLMLFGVSATNSFTSDVSRFFTGSPTDKAIWLLIAGVVVTVVGLTGLVRCSKEV